MTCCRSRSFSVSLDGMVSARSIRHLTTARLLWAGLWDAKTNSNSNKESAIKDHAETTDHDIDTGYVEILEKNVNNWHKRIFLESWHSTIDKNAVNERKPFPSVYKTLLKP